MGTHPIFESDFDCLTEMLPFRRARKYFSQRKRYLIFKDIDNGDLHQWLRGTGNRPNMRAAYLIRLPAEYRPTPIRNWTILNCAYPEIYLDQRHPKISAEISNDIANSVGRHFESLNFGDGVFR